MKLLTGRLTATLALPDATGTFKQFGIVPVTAMPAVVSVASQPGFSIVKGGNLAGSYTIQQFANCGPATVLINLTIRGPGKRLMLTLGKPTFGG